MSRFPSNAAVFEYAGEHVAEPAVQEDEDGDGGNHPAERTIGDVYRRHDEDGADHHLVERVP